MSRQGEAANHRQWGPPYLLYLGTAADDLAIKTARGLAFWRPEWCVGQHRHPDCRFTLGLPEMGFADAKAAGADTMVIGNANAGGVMSPETVTDVIAALDAGLNVVAGDQYIALVLPVRVFRAEFARRGLAPFNLSRLAADSATVTSPLIAWNSCGAYMGAVLGVSAFRYLPYAIFCYASPALSVLYGITGFKIEKIVPAESNRRKAHGLSRD